MVEYTVAVISNRITKLCPIISVIWINLQPSLEAIAVDIVEYTVYGPCFQSAIIIIYVHTYVLSYYIVLICMYVCTCVSLTMLVYVPTYLHMYVCISITCHSCICMYIICNTVCRLCILYRNWLISLCLPV